MRTVSIIGYGQIGRAVVEGIGDSEGWRLGRVLTRKPVPELACHTNDPEVFFARRADLIIEAAGPGALRALGVKALAAAPLWSVGAVAMADAVFREQVEAVAQKSGYQLRLFACGMADMPLVARRLRITMRGPEIDSSWAGKLSEAVERWPDHLNTAVATALNGPGIAATELVMEGGGPETAHEINIEAEGDDVTWQRTIRFDLKPDATHPVAQMLLTELAREGRGWQGV